MQRFSNLPQSAMDNIASLGRKMEEFERRIREDLHIKDSSKVSLTRCWDGTIRVTVDGEIIGVFNYEK